MIKLFQKVSVFYISRFEAAAKAMKECGKQPWTEKVSKDEIQQLQRLYKQATQGVYNTMTQEKGTSPNFDSPMNSFRSAIGKQTVQGATQGDILKQQLNQTFQKNPGSEQNKGYFNQSPRSPENAGIKQTKATQSLAKGQTVSFSEPKPKINQEIKKSATEMDLKEDFGNRSGFQQIPGSMPPGSNPSKKKEEGLNKTKSKEQIENEYVNLAKNILQKHNAEKYIKDF